MVVAKRVELTPETLVVHLADGRALAIPFSAIPRLATATEGERFQWRIVEDGALLQWIVLGLTLSVADLVAEAARSFATV